MPSTVSEGLKGELPATGSNAAKSKTKGEGSGPGKSQSSTWQTSGGPMTSSTSTRSRREGERSSCASGALVERARSEPMAGAHAGVLLHGQLLCGRRDTGFDHRRWHDPPPARSHRDEQRSIAQASYWQPDNSDPLPQKVVRGNGWQTTSCTP